jgi:hypothetical protein
VNDKKEKMKTALIAIGAVVAVALAGFMGWNALRDNSQPIDSPTYAKLSPEERERIHRETIARRNGQLPPLSRAAVTSKPPTK